MGVQTWQRDLSQLRQGYVFPAAATLQPVLLAIDCLLYDRVFVNRFAFPGEIPAPKRCHDILPELVDAVEIHTSLDFSVDDKLLCSQLKQLISRFKCRDQGPIFVVGGVTGLFGLPPVSLLENRGGRWATRVWNIFSAVSAALNRTVIILGFGVCPRNNPDEIERHAMSFIEEMCRLHDSGSRGASSVKYRDIFTPNSFQEFTLDSDNRLVEKPDHIDRFIRDLVIVIGEALNPIYKDF
jgi:hypothetical protein